MLHWKKNKTSARDNETQYDFIDGYSQNLGDGDMYIISL